MSQDGKGAEDVEVAAAQDGVYGGAEGSPRNPFGHSTSAPSIKDISSNDDSSSSDEDEDEMLLMLANDSF